MKIEHEALLIQEERNGKTMTALQNDFATLRAGRANPQLLNRITVKTPLIQMANIAVPEPRLLTISLYDPSALKEMEKAILASDLGLNPSNDGRTIRLVFPEPTVERRQELVKQARKMGEEAKVAIRNIRRDAMEDIRKSKKDNEITEDDQKILEEDCQKITDDYIKKVEALLKDKESEIMEI